MQVINVTLPLPPSANRYWRNFKGRMVKSKEARQHRIDCMWAIKAQGFTDDPIRKPVGVWLEIYFPNKRGDLDNRIKVVLDSMNGLLYEDDKQIIEIHARRLVDKENPRVDVKVMELVMVKTKTE